MSSKLYIGRSPAVASRKLGGEMMIMSARDSTLFTLNEVATVIWEFADGSLTLDEIVELGICSEFDVQTAEAVRDAEILAKALAQHGILRISREPILGSTPPDGDSKWAP
jgi:Coenzyme PQQ synthesis protein D (PqqD)